jgi:hypothetical protein
MRFRLKTEFITFAHDQIRGGLWYKPTWWEAVQKVPPTAVMPRLKKKYIPRIRFVEDRLMREFTARNPSLKTLDERNFARGRTSSIAAQFVEEQLRQMRADKSEAASFDVASKWLVENGAKVLKKVDPNLVDSGKVDSSSLPPEDAFQKVMDQQEDLVRAALAEEERMRYVAFVVAGLGTASHVLAFMCFLFLLSPHFAEAVLKGGILLLCEHSRALRSSDRLAFERLLATPLSSPRRRARKKMIGRPTTRARQEKGSQRALLRSSTAPPQREQLMSWSEVGRRRAVRAMVQRRATRKTATLRCGRQ